MSRSSNSEMEKSISSNKSNNNHSDSDEYGSDDFDFVSSSEATKDEAFGAHPDSSNSVKKENDASVHSQHSSSNGSESSNRKTLPTNRGKKEESNDDAYGTEGFESMNLSTASKKDSKQNRTSSVESSEDHRTDNEDTSVVRRKLGSSSERKYSDERSEDRTPSLSAHSRHSPAHDSFSTRTNSTVSSSNHSEQNRFLMKKNSPKSASLSSDDSARKGKEGMERHQESSLPERSSRSSTPKSFSSSSSVWDSRASHSPAAKRSASSSRSSSPKEKEKEASHSLERGGRQKTRKSAHHSRLTRSKKTKAGRGRRSKSRRKKEDNKKRESRNADELQAAPRVSSSHSSQSSRERSHRHHTYRREGSLCRPIRVPENQEELDAMQRDNERMKNELFRIHRERLDEENQRKRREIKEAKEGGFTLSRREQFCKVVQAMIMDDNHFRLLRSEEKSLLQEREEVLKAIRKYRQGMRYKSLLERSKTLLEQATEEHHDLSLEVRCNEKLLLMNANVMETGEGALRLREEIRSQNALGQRELQHCVRDLVETEKQKTTVEEEVRQLHEEIDRLRSEKKSEKQIEMDNERNALEKLKLQKKSLQKTLESLKPGKSVEKGGESKQRGVDPISLSKKGHQTSATRRSRRNYTKEKKAEKEYLESRIRAMRGELEQLGDFHLNGGSLSVSGLSSPHASFVNTDHHVTPPSSSFSSRLHPRAAGQDGYTEDGGLAGHEARLAAEVRKTSSQFKNNSIQSPPTLPMQQPRLSPSPENPSATPSGVSGSSAPWLFETRRGGPLPAHVEFDEKGKNGATPLTASVGERREEEKNEEKDPSKVESAPTASSSIVHGGETEQKLSENGSDREQSSHDDEPPDWLKDQPEEGEERSSEYPELWSPSHKEGEGEQKENHNALEGQDGDKGSDRSASSSKSNSRSSVLDKLLSDGLEGEPNDEEKKEKTSVHDEDKGNEKSDDNYSRHSSEEEADSRVGKRPNDDTLNFLDDEETKEEKEEEPSASKNREAGEKANAPDASASSEDEYQDSAFEDEEDEHEEALSTHTPTLDELLQEASDPQSTSGTKIETKENSGEKNEETGGVPDWLDF